MLVAVVWAENPTMEKVLPRVINSQVLGKTPLLFCWLGKIKAAAAQRAARPLASAWGMRFRLSCYLSELLRGRQRRASLLIAAQRHGYLIFFKFNLPVFICQIISTSGKPVC